MSTIVISEQACIPAWIVDHASFRRWIHSGEFPERGRFCHLHGDLWVDVSMETLSHNQIKQVVAVVLGSLILQEKMGRYFGDGMMLSNLDVLFSTEPDGMFVSKQSFRQRRVVLENGPESLEVIGTPDMILEVVSKTSVRKDTVTLLDLYYRAGIAEYWLIDSRPNQFRFDIYRAGRRKFVPTRKSDGWIKSEVFGKSFKLLRNANGEEGFEYFLAVR